ncbi:hypothetical protein [Actinomadura nitritigenes]|uniref:hypothetical protein n=1 Tax=Actinomadura nitritigenes TaxID=134602 RepID=UPI003D907CA6
MNAPEEPGPGPAPPAPAWSTPPVRPAAGWYAVPVALVVLAAAGLFTTLALARGDASAGAGPAVTGDAAAGVSVRLKAGRTYFLYVRRDGTAPFGCAVEHGSAQDGGHGGVHGGVHGGERGRVRLTRKNSWSAADRPGYRYTASLTAPVTGAAVLTCRGTDGPLLVAPDGTAGFYTGLAFLAVLAACVAAAAGFVLTLTRRSRADQRARLGAPDRPGRPVRRA